MLRKLLFASLFTSLILFNQTANSEVDPNSLVKVNSDSKDKCVTYYNYNGEMYCSTTQQASTPVDPAVKDYEKLKIVFDARPWRAGWGEKNDTIQTVEYVTGDDTVENWKELITSQYLPGMQEKATPMDWANNAIAQLQNMGFNPIVKFIKKDPDQVIFEWRLEEPESQQQDEIQMITKDDTGLYVLHYVIKKPDMGDEARNKWIKNLENSEIAE
jgi:hypothetical protein